MTNTPTAQDATPPDEGDVKQIARQLWESLCFSPNAAEETKIKWIAQAIAAYHIDTMAKELGGLYG